MVRKPVIDPGMDETVKHLNPEKIDRVIKWVFGKEADARFRTYVETCTHCGLCNEACHYYRSYKRDPSYAPASKVSRTLGDILKKKEPPDKDSIKLYSRIAFAECNLCKRCSMYCPFGIDVSYLMALVRRICGLLGVVPQYLQDQAYSHMYTCTMSWLTQDDWIDTVQFVEDELRMEIRDARIPLDKKWTDVMYSPHTLEVNFKTNLLNNIAKILTVAGVDWTMPSTDGWDGTNQAMHAGDYETMGMIERKHFQAALSLHAKKILTSE